MTFLLALWLNDLLLRGTLKDGGLKMKVSNRAFQGKRAARMPHLAYGTIFFRQ